MKKRIYRRICPHHKMPAALMLAILFLLPFSACSNSKSTPAPAESSTAEPVPGSADRTERLVYVPSYEVLPVSMDPITVRFPVETEENVYFFRLVQSAEGAGYRLMRGGKDAAEAVTVASFAPEDYVERIFLTDEGTAWINQTNFTTGDAALLEISLSSGEIMRRAPFDTANGTVTGIFDLPDGSLGVLTVLPNMEQALFSMNEAGNFVQVEAPLNTNGDFFNNVTVCGAAGSGLSAGECLAYDNEYLFAFTPGSTRRRELFCWADWGISSFYTTPLSMNDGVIRLLDNRYKE